MTDLDRSLVRKLAEWSGDLPITSVYLSVDGKEFPRPKDYELHLDDLLRSVREQGSALGEPEGKAVERDVEAIHEFVIGRFERGNDRGLAVFSCAEAGLWEDIRLSRPVRNQAVVAPHPDLLQLESMLETYESICTVLVDSEKARIFTAEFGRMREVTDVEDDVPGRHDQGGWSQGRFERHVDDHRQRHFKHTAEVVFRLFKRQSFDHLLIGGPEEIVAEFEGGLHDYLAQRILDRVNLPIGASLDEVLERTLEAEEDLDRRRVRDAVQQIVAEQAAGRQAVAGVEKTLAALGEARVATLVVGPDLHVAGRECTSCGRLTTGTGDCPTCGSATREVPDVVEAAVTQALRAGARIETATEDGALEELGGVGALLRF